MAEPIESIISKFIDNNIDIEQACREVAAWSESHQGDEKFQKYGTDLLTEMYANHKIGESTHQKLLAAIQNPAAIDSDDDDEATVLISRPNVSDDDDITTIAKPGTDDDDITVIANSEDDYSDDDATVVMANNSQATTGAEDDDVTVVAGASEEEDEDATIVAGAASIGDEDEDATIVAGGSTDVTAGETRFDENGTLIADDEEKTQIATPAEMTGRTGKTKKETTDMTGSKDDFGVLGETDDEEGEELVVGSILKERFNLVSILGEGGMGLVFKAVDMLKVEAKDQNPYVAIKVLTGDFKEHPDAFISLQRETSKAQKLAHPNISTVYDFDRHKGTVYMTMELLNGEPLDEFIKDKMPKEGLKEELALSIIKGLGEGLEYAHDQGLVHSDFKPGNAFIIDPDDVDKMDHIEMGGVKVIDFGIARAAATTTGEKSLHEDEVFDAGSLGALTPAYATTEMYNGEDPHPSDDIYALACVAGQLLTGQHPYKKKPAPKAKDMRLRPPLIPGFTKRQQKAFEKGLAFERKDRTETMEEFLDGIRRRKDYTVQIILGLLVSFSLIGGLGYQPVTKYYEQQEIQEIILATNEGTDDDVKETLASLTDRTEDYQTAIKVGIRDRALEAYVKDINALVDPENKRYEYEKAEGTIEDILSYYPDSSVIAEISSSVAESKQILLGELRSQYVTQLLKKNFLPVKDSEDMTDVLKLLKSVASKDPIFSDPRLEAGYHKATTQAISKSDEQTALTYLKLSKTYISGSTLFRELADQVKTTQLDRQLVLEQTKTENSFEGQTLSIHEYKKYVDDLMILSLNSSFNSKQYDTFKRYFEKEFARLVEDSPTSAKELHTTFSKALTSNEIISYIERTGLAPKLSGNISASAYPRIHFIKDSTNLTGLINQMTNLRKAVAKYRNNVLTHYNLNFEETMDPLVSNMRPTMISYYSKLYGNVLIPETTKTIKSQSALARNNITANIRNVNALATVENDKRIFRNRADENRLNDSISSYDKIAAVATESDNEFIEYAKSEISRMYATLAESNATEYNYQNAYDNILKAKEYLTSELIEKQERNYKKEVMSEEIAALIVTGEETDKIQAQENLSFLKSEYIDDYGVINNTIAFIVNKSIIDLGETELIEAHRLKKHAQSIINSRVLNGVNIKDLPKPSILAAQGKIEVTQFNLSAAKETLRRARAETPNHYQVDELEVVLNEQLKNSEEYYKQYNRYFKEESYDDADTSLSSAIENWRDNSDYINQRAFYDRVMIQVNAGGKLCREDLQGIGKRNRGACNDVVLSNKKAAPTMVVIPAINKDSKPYAISKFEISAANLNTFCEKSDKCTPSNQDLAVFPATRVPAEIISEYANWLSSETGFDYQIASYDEWINATSAAGREGNSDYNCRLRLGTKLIKGQNIVPVESGAQNNWGLINYVGNVDEIVKNKNEYMLVGGNYSDSISDCKITLSKPYNLSNTSGFRLVRSLY